MDTVRELASRDQSRADQRVLRWFGHMRKEWISTVLTEGC